MRDLQGRSSLRGSRVRESILGTSHRLLLVVLPTTWPHNLLRKTKLYDLRKKLGIVSVRTMRKNGTDKQATVQAVLDIKANDTLGRWGVGQVRQRLANMDVLVPR